MSDLRVAAKQALEALCLWSAGRDMDAVALNDLIFRLRDALVEDAMQKFTDVNKELEAELAKEALQCLTNMEQDMERSIDSLKAALADTKVDSQAITKQPSPPPEAQTEAEKIAYCAGWWAAMEKIRVS